MKYVYVYLPVSVYKYVIAWFGLGVVVCYLRTVTSQSDYLVLGAHVLVLTLGLGGAVVCSLDLVSAAAFTVVPDSSHHLILWLFLQN